MMVPMDITVPANVVVTVGMVLHVTNRLDAVTRDVTRDILMITVSKVNQLFCQFVIFFLVYLKTQAHYKLPHKYRR